MKLEDLMGDPINNKLTYSSNQIQKLKSFKETDHMLINSINKEQKDITLISNKLSIPKKLESNREVNYFNKKSKLAINEKSTQKKVLNEAFVIKLKVLSVNLCKDSDDIKQLLTLCKIEQDSVIESLFIDHVFMYKLENLFSKNANITKQRKETFLKAEIKKALEYYSLDIQYKITNKQMSKLINMMELL